MLQNQSSPIRLGRIARAVRRLAAALCFVIVIISLTMAGTSLALRLGWIAKVQIVWVALSVWVSMILFWIAFTLLFGRLYCSVICPLGVLMDIFARLPRLTPRTAYRRRYRYIPPLNPMRYLWAMIIVMTVVIGSFTLLTLFSPWDAFSSIVSFFAEPIRSVAAGSPLMWGSIAGAITGSVTLAVVAIVAVRWGRSLCNTVCPVGSALSLLSRYSLYGIDINTDLCIGCNRCADSCKAHCIDPNSHTVDTSRCVVCFNCLTACEPGAITYTNRRHRLSMPLMMRPAPPQTTASQQS